ncbi:related to 8-oxoguanine DNA-glycosylase [Pseudozyma flocculosa]|nr:related to 8-oxoguanine DNA-glycosylase [Pseudozyma flocculosa]
MLKDEPGDPEHCGSDHGNVFAPLPPLGYTALRAPVSQVLLPLTVSNKCGQAFRWRAIQVWEPASPGRPASKVNVDRKPDLKALGHAATASEDESDSATTNRTDSVAWRAQTEWSLCLSDRVVLLRQDEERGFIYHRTLLPASSSSDRPDEIDSETERWLRDYLNLEVPLEALYDEWASKDKVFARFAHRFTGLRMLRQDPWECLCAFICSSNNNIARIGQMVQNLCTHFSPLLVSHTYPPCPIPPSDPVAARVEEEVQPTSVTVHFHPFPAPERLAEDGVEDKLRELGFGYRAKYIASTARMLCARHRRSHDGEQEGRWDYGVKVEDKSEVAGVARQEPAPLVDRAPRPSPSKRRKGSTPSRSADAADTASAEGKGDAVSGGHVDAPPPHSVRSYLQSLRQLSYSEARQELLQFPGIGPKVADCILLMSLDQPSSIPVDRHVFQFAEKWYSIRSKRYEDIAQRFRELWGEYAGWAHSVLFTADLRSFATYNAAKKEERVEEAGPLLARPSGRTADDGVKKEEMLPGVHSPPRVALPELVASATPSKSRAQRDETLVPGVDADEVLLEAGLVQETGAEDRGSRLAAPAPETTLAERTKARRRAATGHRPD